MAGWRGRKEEDRAEFLSALDIQSFHYITLIVRIKYEDCLKGRRRHEI
jgi:hypothetical protein